MELYADQIAPIKVELKGSEPVTETNRYTFTLDKTTNTNQVDVKVNLENLYKNTNYSITVSGYLNVGDGNDVVNRTIGTVSFRTYETVTLNTTWSKPTETTGAAISRTLALAVQDSQAVADPVRKTYAEDQLKSGQIVVELFSGTGTGKLRIAQKNYNESADLEKIFGSGLTITEADFGNPPLNKDGNYTLTVSEVADKSYALSLGYVNTFDDIMNAAEVVAAEPTPPDLLVDPSDGVKATPIYNSDIATYGGTKDEKLPDEAIMGYTLEASYDNVQRIGKSITYYAFEYNTFFNALANNDPIKVKGAPLMEMTLPIDSGSNFVPKVAVLFGRTKSTEPKYYNGYNTYYAGEPSVQGSSLVYGMGRGFRYIFAYTVEYAGSSTGEGTATLTYPYGHKDYNDYNLVHGGVKENGVQIGNSVAYVLNSGMCEAPRILPDFHTYVSSTAQETLAQGEATTATGKVELHYKWRDPDKLIIDDNTANNTTITYTYHNNPVSQNVQHTSVGDKWYSVTMNYAVVKGTASCLMPEVNVCAYRLDYDQMLNRFNMAKDEKAMAIGAIPLEWSWEQQFGQENYENIQLSMDMEHLAENFIAFRFDVSGATSAPTNALLSRAISLKLTLRTTGGTTEKTFYLPLVSDVYGTYAKLATGLLGTEFLGKEFKVTEAVLLYDTGIQGWSLLEDPNNRAGFALQYVEDGGKQFEFTNYIGASSLSNVPANGALLTTGQDFSEQQLRQTIGNTVKDDTKMALGTSNVIVASSGSTRYLYPDRCGVDAHNSTLVSQLSGRYLTPKKVAAYKLSFPLGGDQGTLSQMTPTIDNPHFAVSSTEIKIENIRVYGLKNSGTIYAAAYESRDEAEKLGVPQASVEIAIDSDGKPTADPALTSLVSHKKYYVAFYHVPTAGERHLLLTADTAQVAVYEVTTSRDAVIKVLEQEYRNNSYFDKSMVFTYSIDRLFNINISYDIYASERDAIDGKKPVLTHKQMATGDENAILNAPTTLSWENQISINLRPSANRAKLEPGKTYYLKISATEGDGTPAGNAIEEFTLKAIGNYDALIYVSNAKADSITFWVTINDPQYTLMGRDKGAGKYEGALYAVRFTDEQGNLLRTNYDDEVYSANDLRKEFVLSKGVLKNDNITANQQIEENKTYQIHIYAVPDADHNGTIQLTGEEQLRDWTKFFKRDGDMKGCGTELQEIIAGFWNNDTSHKENPVEAQLKIASKSQKTTTEEGWILNEDGVYPSRFDPTTVRIQFEESVGLLGTGESAEPVFKQIDWSVTGKAGDGSPVSASGTARYSRRNTLLQSGKSGGYYDMYYYDIPYELGQGNYVIVLQFRTTEEATSPTKSITIRSGV